MIINNLKNFLEKIDHYRNEALFLFIKPYWPRKISPNAITWIRIIIGIILVVLLFWLKIDNKILILSLFCIGAFTDLIDGPIARGLNKVTELGAMMDSTADRILIIPIAIYSLYPGHKWLLLILILMEILNLLTSLFYKSKEIYLESNIFGKTKMTLFSIVLIAILLFWPNSPAPFFIYVLWSTILFSLLSMFVKITEIYETQSKNL